MNPLAGRASLEEIIIYFSLGTEYWNTLRPRHRRDGRRWERSRPLLLLGSSSIYSDHIETLGEAVRYPSLRPMRMNRFVFGVMQNVPVGYRLPRLLSHLLVVCSIVETCLKCAMLSTGIKVQPDFSVCEIDLKRWSSNSV